MSTNYSVTSPYYGNPLWGQFLDMWPGKNIMPAVTDALFQINSTYNLRPDLLAYDMYQDSGLWWVFAVRNPDVIQDPLMDFKAGAYIYVPTRTTVNTALGL